MVRGFSVLFLALYVMHSYALEGCIHSCVTNHTSDPKTPCGAASLINSCARTNDCYSKEADTICRQVTQLGLCLGHTLSCEVAPAHRACVETTAACTTRRSVGIKSDPCSIVRIQQECALEAGCYNNQLEYLCNTFADFGCTLDCPISCPDITWPINGARIGENFLADSVINFQCNSGLTLVGPTQIRCLGSGNWTDDQPICIDGSPCAVPTGDQLGGSRIVGTPKAEYISGETLNFECIDSDDDTYLDGSRTSVCLPSGMWSSDAPVCRSHDGPGSNWWIALIIIGFLFCVVWPCMLYVLKLRKQDQKAEREYTNVSGSPARSLGASSPAITNGADPRHSMDTPVLDPMHQTTWMSLNPSDVSPAALDFNAAKFHSPALPAPPLTTTAPVITTVPPVSPTSYHFH